jgi:hypothetical protein
MREFYRDLHKSNPELEEKVWIMETHATRSPVPGDVDTYNHWMTDEDVLKMARVVSVCVCVCVCVCRRGDLSAAPSPCVCVSAWS